MKSRILTGIGSLVVVACHAAWKWAGAGGTSYPGTIGTLGPVFFIALLLWPMFAVSTVYFGSILLGAHSADRPKVTAALFLPIIVYGIYFLVVGGSGERAGLR